MIDISQGEPLPDSPIEIPYFGLNSFSENPWILGSIVVLLGVSGVPMSPVWGFLGYRLGFIQGLMLAWPCAVLAAGLQFQLLRWVGSRLPGWNRMISHEGKVIQRLMRLRADLLGLILARLAWAIPFVAVNAWASASQMRLVVFLSATTIAIFPNIIGLVGIGATVAQLGNEGNNPWSILGLFGSLSCLGLILLLVYRLVRKQ